MTALHKKLSLLPTSFVLVYEDFQFQALIMCPGLSPYTHLPVSFGIFNYD